MIRSPKRHHQMGKQAVSRRKSQLRQLPLTRDDAEQSKLFQKLAT
jgi:hypothetical protein